MLWNKLPQLIPPTRPWPFSHSPTLGYVWMCDLSHLCFRPFVFPQAVLKNSAFGRSDMIYFYSLSHPLHFFFFNEVIFFFSPPLTFFSPHKVSCWSSTCTVCTVSAHGHCSVVSSLRIMGVIASWSLCPINTEERKARTCRDINRCRPHLWISYTIRTLFFFHKLKSEWVLHCEMFHSGAAQFLRNLLTFLTFIMFVENKATAVNIKCKIW